MIVKQIYKNRIVYIDDDWRVEYKGGHLFFIHNFDNKLIYKYPLDPFFYMRLLAKCPVFDRLLRCEPRSVMRWSEESFFVSHRGCFYKVDMAEKRRKRLFRYAPGTKNPLHFCEYERDGKKELVFGDYGGADADGNIGIYRYTDAGLCRIAFFQKGKVNHVHRVEYDGYRDCYWIFTGDTDEASGIWRISYGESNIVPYLVGKQKYRVCVAFVEKDKIVLATDTPHEKNYIYSMNVADGSMEQICHIPGPCIYGIKIKKGTEEFYCFSTSVEPNSLLPGHMYKFTYQLGLGIEDRFSYVVLGNLRRGFQNIWRSEKDILPMWLFQFGNHRFPSQHVKDRIFFCPQSCRKVGGTLAACLCENGD